ncbi:hypothetical protein [Chitinophaga rhizosphaerae]|uniref:hypothetical protein n=1 Tax=Chitinophaga rhizosphaerae TaxID=1864947 RepID=UPI0013E0C21C|nr:hypothetical protein [Chitinophaga rhizosphaerae]
MFAQVSLPAGTVDLNFPLFEYSDASRLATKISLNYKTGSGIPVNEMASCVGLGWDISFGGVINRQTMGEPDDQSRLNVPGINSAFDGYLNTPYDPLRPVHPWIGYTILSTDFDPLRFTPEILDDRQQDIFHFNINGNAGSFVIGRNGEIRTLIQSRFTITKTELDMTANNILTRINQFIVTDENGIQYKFRDLSTSRVYRFGSSGSGKTGEAFKYFGWQNQQLTENSIVTSWHLSEILNPLSGKKITFTYEDSNQEYVEGVYPMKYTKTIDGEADEVIQVTENKFKGIIKVLKNIVFPDNLSVELTYNPVERVDLAGAGSLQKLAVKNGAAEMYRYNFTYSYFSKADMRAENYAFPADEKQYARLCLASFRKTGRNNETEAPYVFTYARGNATANHNWIPRRAGLSRDYWGYFNTITEAPINETNQWTINSSHFENFNWLFHYRLKLPYNDPARHPGSPQNMPALSQNGMVKSVTTPNGGKIEYEYEGNTALGPNGTAIMGGVRVKNVQITDGMPGNQPIVTTYKYVRKDGNTSGWGYEDPVFTSTRHIIMHTPSNSAGIIASSTFKMIAGTAGQIQSLYSSRNRLPDQNQKLGVSQTVNTYLNIAMNVIMYLKLLFSNGTTTEYDLIMHHPNGYANLNPIPKLYSRIEVINGTETSNLGKTVYEFTSDADVPLTRPTVQLPYSNIPRYMPWAYGLLKSAAHYNSKNELISETINEYNLVSLEGGSNHANMVAAPQTALVADVGYYNGNFHRIRFAIDNFSTLFGRAELKRTIQRIYGRDGHFSEDVVDYNYDPTTMLLKKVVTMNEKGEKIEKKVYYAADFTSSQGALGVLRSNHVKNLPVSNETWLVKSETDRRLLSFEAFDYQIIANGDFRATKKFELKTNKPLTVAAIGEFNPASLVRNTDYIKEVTSHIFNSHGEISDINSGGRIVGMIYNDAGTAIIGRVEHGASNQIAYSSFEEGQTGNWAITGTPAFVEDVTTPTGLRSLDMSGVTSIRKAGLNATSKYMITYWAKSGSLSVNGTVHESRTGRTVNGWTIRYLTVSGNSEIILTGTGIIDELRLYPVNSVLQTFTYDIAGNIISETTGTDLTVKKEYDGLNRLRFSRDQYNNILEAYQYTQKSL